ncbi:uncharacterized protein LOC143026307 [Oratosquilla oratoria]|uniref:uncharacterized protein LOC143026307 n=1 Tax=Oratosquilla oratoria TaxID=337810 RepID=UPI003F7715A3
MFFIKTIRKYTCKMYFDQLYWEDEEARNETEEAEDALIWQAKYLPKTSKLIREISASPSQSRVGNEDSRIFHKDTNTSQQTKHITPQPATNTPSPTLATGAVASKAGETGTPILDHSNSVKEPHPTGTIPKAKSLDNTDTMAVANTAGGTHNPNPDHTKAMIVPHPTGTIPKAKVPDAKVKQATTTTQSTQTNLPVGQSPANPPQNGVRTTGEDKVTPICRYYEKGRCRHGNSGRECNYRHPKPCRKLLMYGTRDNRGCKLARGKCPQFHPRMCSNSIRHNLCQDKSCNYTHVKGTWKPSKAKTQVAHPNINKKKASNLGVKPQNTRYRATLGTPTGPQTNPCSNISPSFLEISEVLQTSMTNLSKAVEYRGKVLSSLMQGNQRNWPPLQAQQVFPWAPVVHTN